MQARNRIAATAVIVCAVAATAFAEDAVIPLRNGRLAAADLLEFAEQNRSLPLASTFRELRDYLRARPELVIPVELVEVAAALDGSSVDVRYDEVTGRPTAIVIPTEQVLRRASRLKAELYPRLAAGTVPQSGIVAVEDTQGDDTAATDEAAGSADLSTTVLVIAGYRSQHDEAVSFARQVHDRTGLPTAVFYYPTSVPVAANGKALSEAISRWAVEHPDGELAIVSHSMGGLIARYAVEAMPPEHTSTVRRLIQIFPPNHGSRLAELTEPRDAVDLARALLRRGGDADRAQDPAAEVDELELPASRETDSAIDASLGLLIEGFGGASRDLRPGSQLLSELNSRPRRGDIDYTIIAGTDAPLSRWIALAGGLLDRRLLERAGQRELGERIEPMAVMLDRYATADELVEGRGDGAVALASTRLAGVSDHVVLDANHFAWARDEDVELILEEVESRLRQPE